MPGTTASYLTAEPFAALAPVYRTVGLGDYAKGLAPNLLNLAFGLDWIGSTGLDLGCGTGEMAGYLAEHGLRMFAFDTCREMLVQAEADNTAKGITVEWQHGDLRAAHVPTPVDLVTCIGTLNYLQSVSDLELAFRAAASALAPAKLFVFDLHTIRGLAEAAGTAVIADLDTALVFSQNTFSYEALTLSQTYHVLRYNGSAWSRAAEHHSLRGYPTAPIGKLLAKYGLHLLKVLDPLTNQPADPFTAHRILFVAQKEP